jgi:DNA transformation protein and related proteins
MPTPVTSIPNLGPATAREFARAGITTADEIKAEAHDPGLTELEAALDQIGVGYRR